MAAKITIPASMRPQAMATSMVDFTQLAAAAAEEGGMLNPEPGLHIFVERLPLGRARVSWVDVRPSGAHAAGCFECAETEFWEALERQTTSSAR